MKSRIVIFLPTYNERENLPAVVERLLDNEPDRGVLVVDDQSPDGTGQIADQLAQRYAGRMEVIHRGPPRGRGWAGIVGLREAAQRAEEYVVEMDADLSHDPAQLPELLAAVQNADVVIGSRYVDGGGAENFGWARHLNSAVARWLTWLFLGLRFTDPTSGYRVYRKAWLEPLPWDAMISPGPSIVEETLYHLVQRGARVIEAPIVYRERGAGQSKITPGIILRWILTMIRIRRTAS